MSFRGAIIARKAETESSLCIGLDPHPHLFDNIDEPEIAGWTCEIIETLHTMTVAFKFQLAFYLAYGERGIDALRMGVDLARSKRCLTIIDAKVSDIPSTMRSYFNTYLGSASQNALHFGADALTVNPYLGLESIIALANTQDEQERRGLYVVASPVAAIDSKLHESATKDAQRYTNSVIEEVARHNDTNLTLGLVTSALSPEIVRRCVDFTPKTPILIPGIGAQGGIVSDFRFALSRDNANLFSVSRGIYGQRIGGLGRDEIVKNAERFLDLAR